MRIKRAFAKGLRRGSLRLLRYDGIEAGLPSRSLRMRANEHSQSAGSCYHHHHFDMRVRTRVRPQDTWVPNSTPVRAAPRRRFVWTTPGPRARPPIFGRGLRISLASRL